MEQSSRKQDRKPVRPVPGKHFRKISEGFLPGWIQEQKSGLAHITFRKPPLLFFIRRRCCWLCVRLHLSLILYGGQFGNNLFGIF